MAKKLPKAVPNLQAMVDTPVTTPAPASTLRMLSPSGEMQDVRPDQAGTLRVLGYQDVTPELEAKMADQAKYGGTLGQAGAAALGFLRGATIGTSDLIARGAENAGLLPQGTTEDIRKLEEVNPDESLVGELGSFVVPGVAALKGGKVASILKGTGAAQAAVGKVGTALGEAAGKAAGKTLEGVVAPAVKLAAESAIFKAGQNISENALQNKPLTVEAVMSDLGPAAILGAGLGAALPVGLRVAKAGAEAALDVAPVRWAVDKAGEKVAQFLDPQHALQIFSGAEGRSALLQDTIKGKRFREQVKHLWDEGAYQPGEVAIDDATGRIVKVAEGGQLSRREMAARWAELEEQSGRVLSDTIEKADAAIADSGVVPATFGFSNADADRVINKIAKFSRTSRINDAQELALFGQLEQDALRVREARTFTELHELRQGLDQRIGDLGFESTNKPAVEISKDIRRIVSDKIKSGLAEVEPDLLGRWNNANATFGALKNIGDALGKQVTRADVNVNVLGLRFRDLGIGAIAGGVGGGPVGLGAALANKAIQTDQGLLMRAALGDKLATLGWLKKATDAAERGIAKSMSDYVKSANVDAIAATATRKLGTKAAGAAVAIEDSVTTPAERHKAQQAWFDKTAAELQKVASDPSTFAQKQGAQLGAIAENAPQIAEAISAKQLQVYAYLLQAMPKNPSMPFNLLGTQWQPSDYDIQRFKDVVKTAQEPMSVLKDLHAGTLSRDQTKALQSLYPELYQTMLMQVQSAVTKPGVNVSYDKRLQLGMLFPGIEPSLAPGFITKMQSTPTPPEEQSGITGYRPGGAAKGKGGASYATKTDTLNERT